MALRKLMNLNEIKKHRRAIMRGISALSYELEQLAQEANYDPNKGDWQDQTCEEEFIEDKVYGNYGADDIIAELIELLQTNRLDVKERRRNGYQV